MAKLTKFKAQQVEFPTHYQVEETNRGNDKIKSIVPAFGNIRENGTPETEEIYDGIQLGNVHTLQANKMTSLNIDYYVCNLDGLNEFGLNKDLKLRINVDYENTNTTTKLRLNNNDYTLLKEQNGTLKQIEAGDIHSNKTYELIYNGSQFVIINLFKNFESAYLDNYVKTTDLAQENKAGIVTLNKIKGLIPAATNDTNGTINLRQINDMIDIRVPSATNNIAGKVMLGTTRNTALEGSRLGEILGLEFGGKIQDAGSKIKGKFYYDSVTKFYYECLENTNFTYNDSGKFRAISNKPISDKVENLFRITTYNLTFEKDTVKNGIVSGVSVGNVAIFQFHDVIPANSAGSTVICKLPIVPVKDFECVAYILGSGGKTERVSVEKNGNVCIIGPGVITPNIPYTFSFMFPFIL